MSNDEETIPIKTHASDQQETINNDDTSQGECTSTGKLVLKVKTMSEKPIIVEVLPTTSIAQFKAIIQKKVHAEDKFLRLIHQVSCRVY